MKQILFLLLIGFSMNMYSQEYINIGSTKQNVKDVQGEPESIESYKSLGEEVWGYGELGVASVTFKNGKVKSFRNYQNILRIGDIKPNSPESNKESDSDELKQLLKRRDNYDRSKQSEYSKGASDITGLGLKPGSESSRVPDRFADIAKEYGWDATSMSESDMERAASKILFERNIRNLFIFLGISLVATLIYFKYFKRKLNK
ncbi:hypothetical protein M2T92_11815 [Elizabethkingia miricola]|uniref:hypothetical protein n=1 Tax=Elizabethkingia miricola TaxID=172045 RepID=UPI002011B949|nr:hypothetical protein [Elizabethkingia miricola]MCL1679714.1 hypothetical protein [Elizabethkingia miricola]